MHDQQYEGLEVDDMNGSLLIVAKNDEARNSNEDGEIFRISEDIGSRLSSVFIASTPPKNSSVLTTFLLLNTMVFVSAFTTLR